MKIGFVTMEKMSNRRLNSVGSSRIRARWVAKYWEGAEEWRIGGKYDVLIFQKAWWENMIHSFKGIKIFDICDPDFLDSSKYPFFGLMGECDAVTTSTQALADYIKKLLPKIPVLHIKDRIDLEEHKQIKKKYEGRAKSCVWFGYSHNFKYVEKTLDKVMSNGLELTVIADKPLRTTGDYTALRIKNVSYDYKSLNEEIIKHDIVLLPNPTGQDFRGKFKSNNKMLTAWALGMPVAIEPEDLDKLMDPKEREKYGKLGRAKVEKEYDVKLSVLDYKKLINDIKDRKRR